MTPKEAKEEPAEEDGGMEFMPPRLAAGVPEPATGAITALQTFH
jgi:hypothetical protein